MGEAGRGSAWYWEIRCVMAAIQRSCALRSAATHPAADKNWARLAGWPPKQLPQAATTSAQRALQHARASHPLPTDHSLPPARPPTAHMMQGGRPGRCTAHAGGPDDG